MHNSLIVSLLAAIAALLSAPSTSPAAPADPVRMTDGLAIGGIGRSGRVVFHTDAIEDLLVQGAWQSPTPGAALTLPDGSTQTWEPVQAGPDGWISSDRLAPGYVCWTVESPADRIAILNASGHSGVYVNGVLRAGDPYRNGIMQLPVQLRAGVNEFLFLCARGGVFAQLEEPKGDFYISHADATVPDFVPALNLDHLWIGIVVVNATAAWRDACVSIEDEPARGPRCLGSVPPLSSRKFPIAVKTNHLATTEPARAVISLQELSPTDAHSTLDSIEFSLGVRDPAQPHSRTFISDIDGSVQYYVVNPARDAASTLPAAVLSLHGAGVDAGGQAGSYAQKTWATIIAPTNRRPFGFDWEDWGRLDALEVLAHARNSYPWDPAQTYLTGHSMGGHGTWQLGALFPDKFAAIGPSAGWISFETYAGGGGLSPDDPVQSMLRRGGATSLTLDMGRNFAQQGVYILHGDADDNVPVDQARQMVKFLSDFHRDFRIHEQPGAGHWWGNSDEPGTECLDWPEMFDFFARRRLPDSRQVRDIHFTTANPGVSSDCHWASIHAQVNPGQPSTIDLRFDPYLRRVTGTTTNVARIVLHASRMNNPALTQDALAKPIQIILDGHTLDAVAPQTQDLLIVLARDGDAWHPLSESDLPSLSRLKNPARNGFFKDAFRNHALLVYGTAGSPEETAALLTKARYDAETFYYRGNGAFQIVSDADFLAGAFTPTRRDDGTEVPATDRNVILYGNADTNQAWQSLLGHCPIHITRSRAQIGDRAWDGPDLACLFVYPRADSRSASVGVVAGTGSVGTRLMQRIPYFVSGVGIPDLLLMRADALRTGSAGIARTGFFGNDWSAENGQWADSQAEAPSDE